MHAQLLTVTVEHLFRAIKKGCSHYHRQAENSEIQQKRKRLGWCIEEEDGSQQRAIRTNFKLSDTARNSLGMDCHRSSSLLLIYFLHLGVVSGTEFNHYPLSGTSITYSPSTPFSRVLPRKPQAAQITSRLQFFLQTHHFLKWQILTTQLTEISGDTDPPGKIFERHILCGQRSAALTMRKPVKCWRSGPGQYSQYSIGRFGTRDSISSINIQFTSS